MARAVPFPSAQSAPRHRPLAELTAVLALLELGLWGRVAENWAADLLLYGALVAVLGLGIRRLWRCGLVPPRPRVGRGRAWAEAALGSALLAAGTAALAILVREPYDELEVPVGGPLALAAAAGSELAQAAVQQIPLQLFLLPVCLELVRRAGWARALAAVLFGLLHLPSPFLAGASAVAGYVWTALYRRGGRLAPLLLSHALVASTAAAILPARLHYDMRVGRHALESGAIYGELGREPIREILRAVSSDAYYERQGGDERRFLEALYRDLLGRTPAPREVESWLPRLRATSRARVAKRFVTSPEFRERWQGRFEGAHEVPQGPTSAGR